MTQKERSEIYKAINNVSKKVNDVSQKLDEFIQQLNAQTEEKVLLNSGAVDDIGSVVTTHDEAIEELAIMIAGLESEDK